MSTVCVAAVSHIHRACVFFSGLLNTPMTYVAPEEGLRIHKDTDSCNCIPRMSSAQK